MALPLRDIEAGVHAVSAKPELIVLPGGQEKVDTLVASVYAALIARLEQVETHMYDSSGILNPGLLTDIK